MNYYTKAQTTTLSDHTFAFIEIHRTDHVLTLVLNRPDKKNALHPQMINEIAFVMNYVHSNTSIWMMVLRAKGNVFCAGADLKAMAGIIEPNNSTIPLPKKEILIGELFNKIYKPTIALVTGDVYAGGFFFLAGCNIVLAREGLAFGLPEVKRGLYPFQVMAALLRVMPARKVVDWCIRGYNLSVQEALKYGLVSKVCNAQEIEGELDSIVNQLLENSPTAISRGLEAYDHLRPSESTHKYLNDMLKKTIKSRDGQEGLKAFREKRMPVWSGS